jgi:HEXXH motif-containing protein
MLESTFECGFEDRPELYRLFRQFSAPQAGFDESVLNTICTAHWNWVGMSFLERHEKEIAQNSTGLDGMLSKWLQADHSSRDVWNWVFGPLQAGNCDAEVNPATTAAQLGLWIMFRGEMGEWEASFESPIRLRWGPLLLPETKRVSVVRTADRVDLRLHGLQLDGLQLDGSSCEASFEGNGGVGDFLREGRALDQLELDGGRKLTFLFADAAPSFLWQSELQRGAGVVEEIDSETMQRFRDGIDILRHHARPYLSWVSRLVSEILVKRSEADGIASGSTSSCPGLISVSVAPAAAIVEMLVHESSHQYFNIVKTVGPLVNPADTQMYYSPAVKKNRPLERILLAYHAFANVLLMYRLCLDKNIEDDGYCASNSIRLKNDVEQLEEPLRDNPNLTPLGKALCEPLISQLSA